MYKKRHLNIMNIIILCWKMIPNLPLPRWQIYDTPSVHPSSQPPTTHSPQCLVLWVSCDPPASSCRPCASSSSSRPFGSAPSSANRATSIHSWACNGYKRAPSQCHISNGSVGGGSLSCHLPTNCQYICQIMTLIELHKQLFYATQKALNRRFLALLSRDEWRVLRVGFTCV